MTIRAVTLLLLLSGAAAWAVDQPGQHFLLKPSDLPKPYPAERNRNRRLADDANLLASGMSHLADSEPPVRLV